MNLKKVIKNWLDFLFPKKCLICEKDKEYLCFKCFKSLKFKEINCPNCGNFSKIGEFCSKCKEYFFLEGVLIAGDFNDKKISSLIKYYKYKFIKELGKYLSSFLFNFIINNIKVNPILTSNKILDIENFLIIPVPLSKKRLKWRGFNQSEVLAQSISQKLGLKISLQLKRIKYKKAQAKLNKEKRIKNTKNCFKWTGDNLSKQKILIIDDVYTTGSTLNEIAKELKNHQAGEIWGLVIAKG